MGVFNDNYKKNAYVELEKDITQLESKREMPSKDDMARFNANVQFAQQLRLISIEKAKELLSRSELTIAEIAEKCGYKTEFHFMRQFKQKTSLTPTQFRNGDSWLQISSLQKK